LSATWSVVEALAAIARAPGGADTVRAIEQLAGIESDQDRMLRNIEREVQLTRHGPFETAKLHLLDAARRAQANEEYIEEITLARNKFMDALGQHAGAEPVLFASQFNQGLIAVMRGEFAGAGYRFEEAYQAGIKTEIALMKWALGARVLDRGALRSLRKERKLARRNDPKVAWLKDHRRFMETIDRARKIIPRPGLIWVPELDRSHPGSDKVLLYGRISADDAKPVGMLSGRPGQFTCEAFLVADLAPGWRRVPGAWEEPLRAFEEVEAALCRDREQQPDHQGIWCLRQPGHSGGHRSRHIVFRDRAFVPVVVTWDTGQDPKPEAARSTG
jgi:hypothetical protein